MAITYGDLNSVSLLSKSDWDNQNIVEKVANTSLATLVDVGTSMYNSIGGLVGADDLSTRNILQGIGATGAVGAYDANKDVIQALSFVGGIFIPGGAALKLTKAIRAGMKGTSFLSDVRHAEDLTKFENLIAAGQKATPEYKSVRNQIYARGLINNTIDTAAAEFAVMGTFNAHPYMEDYMKDPVSHFALSMAIGGGIGAGLTGLVTHSQLGSILGKVESAAADTVNNAAKLYQMPAADTASSLVALNMAAGNLDNLATMEGTNALTKEMATSWASSMRANMGTIFKQNSSEAIQAVDSASLDKIRQTIQTPQFLGAERFDFFTPGKAGYKQTGSNYINTEPSAVFKIEPTPAEADAGVEALFNKKVFYSQDLGTFVNGSDINSVATAADLYTPKTLPTSGLTHKAFVNKAADLQDFGRTPDLEAAYLANMKFYNDMPTKRLTQVELYHNDLPAINGYLSAVNARKQALKATIAEGGPEAGKAVDELVALQSASVKIYKDDKVRLVNMEEVGANLPSGANLDPSSYIKPTFLEDVNREISSGAIRPLLNNKMEFHTAMSIAGMQRRYILEQTGASSMADVTAKENSRLTAQWANENAEALSKYADPDSGLSPSSIAVLARWIGGKFDDKEIIRNAMASARTLRSGLDSTTAFHDELVNILQSPLVKAQRDSLAKHADASGNVYLYRGLKGTTQGDTPISSYTFNQGVARGFQEGHQDPSLFKIHMDDVVGYLYGGEAEWLVGASTRDALDSLPTAANKAAGTAGKGPKLGKPIYSTVANADLTKLYIDQKANAIASAMKSGMPREVAALRFNTPIDMVDVAASNPYNFTKLMEGKDSAEVLGWLNRWSSPAQIEDALSPVRKTITATAQKDKIMGDTGALLEANRQSLLGQGFLNAQQKTALNNMDSAATERLNIKAAQTDEQYAAINKLWVETSVQAGGSTLMRNLLGHVVESSEIKALREGLKEFVNGKGGNPLYSSADFVTSRMGMVGKLVTEIGDLRSRIANDHFQKLITPVATDLRKLAADEGARTEFAIFDNIRQSSKGYMFYSPEERTFMTGSFDKSGQLIQDSIKPVTEYTVKNDLVDSILTKLQDVGQDVYANQQTLNRIKGVQAPSNIGFWIPSTNLVNKERAYVVNHDTGSIKLLVGNSPDDLKAVVSSYNPAANETIMTATELQKVKTSQMGDLLDDVTRADTTQLKKGIGLVAPDISNDRLADIVNGILGRINYQATNFLENSLFDTMQKLDYMSSYNKTFLDPRSTKGFMGAVRQLTQKDTAADIKDILLGNNPAYRSEFIQGVNKTASATIQVGINAFNAAFNVVKPALNKAGEILPGSKPINYDNFSATLAAHGIEDPYKVFNEAARPFLYERAKNSGYSVTPDRIINAGNALASTLALKFMEVAQPLVNMMSMPILTISTINRAIKSTAIDDAAQLLDASPLSVMMGGVRRATSQLPENKRFMKMFEDDGLLSPIVSEVDEVIKQSRFGTGSFVGGLEKALDSNFVKVMSKPAELGETMTRKVTLMTGVELARRLYGNNASDRQIAIFARDFMKQSLGNYSTAQRPMMFQGSFGAAAGLFQTYMLTYAQNMYRHLDLKDYKGLGQTMLAQAGIFGVGSLPGFQAVSQAIGSNFSDEHMDLTTGTFRALGDPLASVILYGLPSNIAPDVHTRGDVNPRVPTGFSTMVAPSIIGQTLGTLVQTAKAMGQQDIGAGQAFMEALALQSVSRPIARLSELASGTSITGARNQIAGPEEVWSWQGILARVMSTRPLSESKTREAINLHSVYGAIDSENRKAILGRMRTAIRSDNLTDELMDELAYDYLRTGSPQGFRAAVNQAMMENSNEKLIDLTNRFGNSPLMLMVDDLD